MKQSSRTTKKSNEERQMNCKDSVNNTGFLECLVWVFSFLFNSIHFVLQKDAREKKKEILKDTRCNETEGLANRGIATRQDQERTIVFQIFNLTTKHWIKIVTSAPFTFVHICLPPHKPLTKKAFKKNMSSKSKKSKFF